MSDLLLDMAYLFFKVILKCNFIVKLVLQIDQSGECAAIFFADALELELALTK